MIQRKTEIPVIRQAEPGSIPEVRSHLLDNNIPVFLIEAGTEDVMRIDFTFSAGQAKESMPLVSSTVNMMLTEGTRKYNSKKLNRLLDFYGSFCNPFADKERAGMVIYLVNRQIENLIELSTEILFNPVFPVSELKALMNKRLRWYLISREKVQTLANDKFLEAVFGKDNPYGSQVTPDDFSKLDRKLLYDFHSSHYTPGNLAIIVSGKIPGNTIELLNKYMGSIKPLPGNRSITTITPIGSGERKIHVEKQKAVQSALRIGSATINKKHPDYTGLKIVDMILGGYFGSRLMKNIREDKGLTYGISSSVNSLNISGYKVISAEVSKKSTQKAVDEIYNEIRLLQDKPVDDEEMAIVRNFMLGEMIRMFDGPFALAESFRSAWESGLDNTYYNRLAKKIKTIGSGEIMQLARTYYNTDELYEITAG
jgi:predicted Zn-dependent peptidase